MQGKYWMLSGHLGGIVQHQVAKLTIYVFPLIDLKMSRTSFKELKMTILAWKQTFVCISIEKWSCDESKFSAWWKIALQIFLGLRICEDIPV